MREHTGPASLEPIQATRTVAVEGRGGGRPRCER
jgi:hypothetical protein